MKQRERAKYAAWWGVGYRSRELENQSLVAGGVATASAAAARLGSAIASWLRLQIQAEVDVILTDGSSFRELLAGGPDLLAGFFLSLVVAGHDVAHSSLEVERTLLHLGVQLAIDKHASAQVLLSVCAKILVLGHNALEHGIDLFKVLVAGILVAEDFIAHLTASRRSRHKSLHEEEVRSNSH